VWWAAPVIDTRSSQNVRIPLLGDDPVDVQIRSLARQMVRYAPADVMLPHLTQCALTQPQQWVFDAIASSDLDRSRQLLRSLAGSHRQKVALMAAEALQKLGVPDPAKG